MVIPVEVDLRWYLQEELVNGHWRFFILVNLSKKWKFTINSVHTLAWTTCHVSIHIVIRNSADVMRVADTDKKKVDS